MRLLSFNESVAIGILGVACAATSAAILWGAAANDDLWGVVVASGLLSFHGSVVVWAAVSFVSGICEWRQDVRYRR
jgi:hypothetical protein